MKDKYSIKDLAKKIKKLDYKKALNTIDGYFIEKNIIITRFWSPKMPGVPEQITLYVDDTIYSFRKICFLWFSWWSLD